MNNVVVDMWFVVGVYYVSALKNPSETELTAGVLKKKSENTQKIKENAF